MSPTSEKMHPRLPKIAQVTKILPKLDSLAFHFQCCPPVSHRCCCPRQGTPPRFVTLYLTNNQRVQTQSCFTFSLKHSIIFFNLCHLRQTLQCLSLQTCELRKRRFLMWNSKVAVASFTLVTVVVAFSMLRLRLAGSDLLLTILFDRICRFALILLILEPILAIFFKEKRSPHCGVEKKSSEWWVTKNYKCHFEHHFFQAEEEFKKIFILGLTTIFFLSA